MKASTLIKRFRIEVILSGEAMCCCWMSDLKSELAISIFE